MSPRRQPRTARTTTRTPPQILAWYDEDLVALTDDPVHQDPAAVLGRAVGVGHVRGAAAGMRETDRLREVLSGRHQWHAVRGHLQELASDLAECVRSRSPSRKIRSAWRLADRARSQTSD